MSYLDKLLEGYFAGLTVRTPRDRTRLQRELASTLDPVERGGLLAELALALIIETQAARYRRPGAHVDPDTMRQTYNPRGG
jgi:hypothetical protein